MVVACTPSAILASSLADNWHTLQAAVACWFGDSSSTLFAPLSPAPPSLGLGLGLAAAAPLGHAPEWPLGARLLLALTLALVAALMGAILWGEDDSEYARAEHAQREGREREREEEEGEEGDRAEKAKAQGKEEGQQPSPRPCSEPGASLATSPPPLSARLESTLASLRSGAEEMEARLVQLQLEHERKIGDLTAQLREALWVNEKFAEAEEANSKEFEQLKRDYDLLQSECARLRRSLAQSEHELAVAQAVPAAFESDAILQTKLDRSLIRCRQLEGHIVAVLEAVDHVERESEEKDRAVEGMRRRVKELEEEIRRMREAQAQVQGQAQEEEATSNTQEQQIDEDQHENEEEDDEHDLDNDEHHAQPGSPLSAPMNRRNFRRATATAAAAAASHSRTYTRAPGPLSVAASPDDFDAPTLIPSDDDHELVQMAAAEEEEAEAAAETSAGSPLTVLGLLAHQSVEGVASKDTPTPTPTPSDKQHEKEEEEEEEDGDVQEDQLRGVSVLLGKLESLLLHPSLPRVGDRSPLMAPLRPAASAAREITLGSARAQMERHMQRLTQLYSAALMQRQEQQQQQQQTLPQDTRDQVTRGEEHTSTADVVDTHADPTQSPTRSDGVDGTWEVMSPTLCA